MTIDLSVIIVSDNIPSGHISSDPTGSDWLWFQPSTDKWHKQVNGEWVGTSTPSHLHPTLGDVNFTGTISVDGEAGLTGNKVLDGKRLTFTNGILTDYELA